MSLLQSLLRSTSERPTDAQDRFDASDDEEWINVASLPGTPARLVSRPQSPSASQPHSPSSGRPYGRTLAPSRAINVPSRDPLRAFPTELSQRIFNRLSIRDLAKCARVSKKWSKSQTINYVWFQHYRRENFQDESLPPGKWTKRESKQNWRTTYLQTLSTREPSSGAVSYSRSGYSSPRGGGSGYQTPKEVNEEKWRAADEAAERPNKGEMREMYKELGGRKSKVKSKLGRPGGGGARDRGGLSNEGGEEW